MKKIIKYVVILLIAAASVSLLFDGETDAGIFGLVIAAAIFFLSRWISKIKYKKYAKKCADEARKEFEKSGKDIYEYLNDEEDNEDDEDED